MPSSLEWMQPLPEAELDLSPLRPENSYQTSTHGLTDSESLLPISILLKNFPLH